MADQNQQQTGGDPQENQQQSASETFEGWLGKQDKAVQDMYTSHVTGLKTALEAERTSKRDVEKQLRELIPQASAGSEAQKKLTEMVGQLSEAQRRATFAEQAPSEGIRNIKAAYTLARADGLITETGDIDFKRLKTAYPELFGPATPPGNAGAGTGTQPPAKVDMNKVLRGAFGR